VLYTSTWPATNIFNPAVTTSWICTKTSGPPLIARYTNQARRRRRMRPDPRDPAAAGRDLTQRAVTGPLSAFMSDTTLSQQNAQRTISGASTTLTRTLDDRLPEPYGVRAKSWISLTACHPNRVQATQSTDSLALDPDCTRPSNVTSSMTCSAGACAACRAGSTVPPKKLFLRLPKREGSRPQLRPL
jgi:hypothetical protein